MAELGWDGRERRAVEIANEQSKPNGKTVEAPIVLLVVGFIAVAILQLGSLWSHVVMDNHIQNEANRSKMVDGSLTCYVVKATQGTAQGPDILTDCGFITVLPGTGKVK